MQHARKIVPSLALALAAGAAFVAARPAAAQEEPARPVDPPAGAKVDRAAVRDAVERQMEGLLSEDPALRERAARAIVDLGEPARDELDRLTRDPDPRRAVAALKLLQSDRWERAAADRRSAERRLLPGIPRPDLDEFQKRLDREMEDLRRRMEEFQRGFDPGKWFDDHLRGTLPEIDFGTDGVRGSSSGQVIENGRSLAWSIDDAGKVKVTTKDGPDAPETTVEAPSLEELRKSHPDVAKRLDAVTGGGGKRFVFRWPPAGREGTTPAPRDGLQPLRPGEEPLTPAPLEFVPQGPMLGIGTAPVPDVLRDQLDLPEGGIVVGSVTPGSLAEKLGMKRNDILLRVADRAITGPADVRKALESIPAGEKVTVEVLRKSKRELLTAAR